MMFTNKTTPQVTFQKPIIIALAGTKSGAGNKNTSAMIYFRKLEMPNINNDYQHLDIHLS